MTTTTHWFADYANIVTLTSYMADHRYEASEIAYAVEKPWKFVVEFNEAQRELDNDSQPGRQPLLDMQGKDGHEAAIPSASRTCAPADTHEATS